MREEMEEEIERVRRSFKAEIVPYKAVTDLVPVKSRGRRIPVERDGGS
jgi:hypothetical protein